MSLEIYKAGQGRYARGIAYVLGLLLVVFGGVRLFANINRQYVEEEAGWLEQALYVPDVPVIGTITIYKTIAFVVALLGLLGLHLVLNRPGTVDMLIDTEQEMKKVSWPSKREVQNSTIVVVLVTFTMAMLLFGFDGLLRWLFLLVYGGD
ncbi:MAG: preprotein translocase subunit SecE [Planctomycetota bacterium]|jgi:preprotein translocase SecE subunit